MIPSSITVSVTLVLMAGPVRIGWMDITVIVHLVSNSRKLFGQVLANSGKWRNHESFLNKRTLYLFMISLTNVEAVIFFCLSIFHVLYLCCHQ